MEEFEKIPFGRGAVCPIRVLDETVRSVSETARSKHFNFARRTPVLQNFPFLRHLVCRPFWLSNCVTSALRVPPRSSISEGREDGPFESQLLPLHDHTRYLGVIFFCISIYRAWFQPVTPSNSDVDPSRHLAAVHRPPSPPTCTCYCTSPPTLMRDRALPSIPEKLLEDKG